MYSLESRLCRIIAWPIWNQYMSQNFDVNMGRGFQIWQQGAFKQQVLAENSLQMENEDVKFELKVSIDAEDSQVCLWYVFFTTNRCFSFTEAVNLVQTLTVQ